MQLRFSELADRRVGLSTQEAIALVLAAAREADANTTPGAFERLPAADDILLNSGGHVSFAASAGKTTERGRVEQSAALLRRLLAFDGESGRLHRAQVPGALLLLLTRAAGEIDLPAPSWASFREALIRFGSPAVALSSIYRRCVPNSDGGAPVEEVHQPAAVLSIHGRPQDAEAHVRDRRTNGPSLAAVRRELRRTELELFQALQPHRRPRWYGRHAQAAAAAALVAAVALWFTLGFHRAADHIAFNRGMPPQSGVAASSGAHSESPPVRVQSSDVLAVDSYEAADTADGAAAAGLAQQPALSPPTRPRVSVGPLLSSSLVGADVFSPSFALQGREVLFHAGRSNAALMRASFDERGDAALATVLQDGAANHHASLSPDGEWLAYDSDRDGTRSVYVARADASEARKVSGDGYAAVPRWSHDGRRLAFLRAEPGRPKVWNVWVMDFDAQTLTRVSRHRVGQAWGGSWFPDGERIAYSVEDTLVIANLKSGTTRTVRSPRRGRLIRTPAVSPDGNWVVFQVQRDGVWLLDSSTMTMRRVLADATAEEFAWSPDSSRVIYHTRRQRAWSLWQLELHPSATG
jgi:Tol biopolymer transport system component